MCLYFFSFQLVSQSEKELIDRIIDHGCQKAGDLDYNLVHSLYKFVFHIYVYTHTFFTAVIAICVLLLKATEIHPNL